MAGVSQPITGAVLQWAIGDEPLDRFAARIGVSESLVAEWIEEAAAPNLGQLGKIAKATNRLPSFFFLPEAPQREQLPTRFRRFNGSTREPGPETLAQLQLAERIQKTAVWLREHGTHDAINIPRISPRDGIEEQAGQLRNWLHWDTNWQTSRQQSEAQVTKSMRTALQERGLLVLHLTLDEGLTRGFSLHSDIAPLIAANTRDPYRARLFSYIHELAHLASRTTALCDVHKTDDATELFCNRIAAAVLMPAHAFSEYARLRFGGRKLQSIEDVATVRNYFKVSLRAVALRAEFLGLGVDGLYERVDREAEPRRKGGRYEPGNERTKPRIRVDEYGFEFIRTISEGIDTGLIRERQAAQLLRVSERELGQARQLSESRLVG